MIENRPLTFSSQIVSLVIIAGCSSSGTSNAAKPKLPKSEFNRVFLAAIQVGAAEHCGDQVDGNLVRANLLKFQAKNGLDSTAITSSGQMYDSIHTDYKSRIANDPDFCTTEYKPSPEKLRQYENGQFPEVT